MKWLDSGFPCCPKKYPEPTAEEIESNKRDQMDLMGIPEEECEVLKAPSGVRRTGKVTLQQYVNLYAGPEYILYS